MRILYLGLNHIILTVANIRIRMSILCYTIFPHTIIECITDSLSLFFIAASLLSCGMRYEGQKCLYIPWKQEKKQEWNQNVTLIYQSFLIELSTISVPAQEMFSTLVLNPCVTVFKFCSFLIIILKWLQIFKSTWLQILYSTKRK